MPATLPVFTPEQYATAQRLLALRVALMMGRKLEEADWTDVYTAALGIEPSGWSNLNIDVMHGRLGVEQKALRVKDVPMVQLCGTTLMHPSLTRSIRVNSSEPDPDVVMRQVFEQYAALVEARRAVVARQNTTGEPVELRSGWLLWQDSLSQFLYFEEPMHVPQAADHFAEWHASGRADGARKQSRNLWIYERESGRKRYSVTSDAGAKIQPYFDVPQPQDPNLVVLIVQGEEAAPGATRVWLTGRTAAEVERVVGSLDQAAIEDAIARAARRVAAADDTAPAIAAAEVVDLSISTDSYATLARALPGVNDDHRFQLLVDELRHDG